MVRAGFSITADADRRDAVHVAWVIAATIVFALALTSLSFFLFDRPHVPIGAASSATWLAVPSSHERVFGRSSTTDATQ